MHAIKPSGRGSVRIVQPRRINMPFENLVKCTNCGWIGGHYSEHEDCPKDPMKDPEYRAKQAEEERAWEKWNNMWMDWCEKNKIDYATFSVSKKGIDDVAFEGRCRFIAYKDEFYGGEESKDFVSIIFDDPTWGDVMLAFEASILATRDAHHQFLEGIRVQRNVPEFAVKDMVPGITLLEFSTGS